MQHISHIVLLCIYRANNMLIILTIYLSCCDITNINDCCCCCCCYYYYWNQEGKTNLDLLEQEVVSGSGISWAICKYAHCRRQITMPAFHHSVFYRPDAHPAAQPTASEHWKQNKYYFTYAQLHICTSNLQLMSVKAIILHSWWPIQNTASSLELWNNIKWVKPVSTEKFKATAVINT